MISEGSSDGVIVESDGSVRGARSDHQYGEPEGEPGFRLLAGRDGLGFPEIESI